MALTPVEVTEGDGPPIQADLVSGAYYQAIKLALGDEGAATLIDVGQQVAAASIPVVLASDQERPGAPSAQAIQVGITDTSTGIEVVTSRTARRAIGIANIGANACDLEPGSATFGAGFRLAAGESVSLSYTGQIKAICNTGLSTTLSVWEEWD